jgi:hypothetical protein
MHSVGGIGWMLENFARAVTLWCTERGDRSFYPYVGGYCWNVVSTLLFHLVTLETGKLSGRGDAIQVYLPEMTRPVADAAAMVTERRYTPDTDIIDIEEHWDVTAQVADWIVDRIATKRPDLFSQSAPPPGPVYMAERYGSALTRAWSHPRSIPIVDVVRKPGESYVASIRDALDLARAEVGPDVTAKEQFELLRDLRAGRASAKVRIWDRASWVRRQRSHDFDLDRGWATDAAVWFGWEDGAQALLQRLHEHLGNQGDEGGELCALSDLCAAIVAEHAGVDPPTASGFDAVAEWLGEHLSAMMPLVNL